MNETAIISLVSIGISLVSIAIAFRHGSSFASRDQLRRGLKVIITGKYEAPKVRED